MKTSCFKFAVSPIFALLVIMLLAFNTSAGEAEPKNFLVSANVGATCSIETPTGISFNYSPIDTADAAAQGNITFKCVQNTPYRYYLAGTREMEKEGDTSIKLPFFLYADSNYSTEFPKDNSGDPITAPDNNQITKNVYGKIEKGKDVPVGSYATTLSVHVEY